MTDLVIVTAESYLSFTPIRCAVPPEFWRRVKAKAKAAGLSDELISDYRVNSERVVESRTSNPWWGASQEMELEQAMFRRWVRRLFGEPTLWPWHRGWTQAAVETYLDQSAGGVQ